MGNSETPNTLILRSDYSGRLSFLVVNSIHKMFVQLIFFEQETSCAINLFNLVSPDDHPPFDSRGKTSLWVDDAQFAPNDKFILIAFQLKSIAVLSRLGTLLKVLNPTLAYV